MAEQGHPDGLYRPAAVTHAARRLDGEVQVGVPLSWKVLTICLSVGFAAVALVCVNVSYARKIVVNGEVRPSTASSPEISAAAGRISLLIREGQDVRKGQRLATIDAAGASATNALQRDFIQAPFDGAVGSLFVRDGDLIRAGEDIVIVLPRSEMDAELFVPPAGLDAIHVGSKLLVYDASTPFRRKKATEASVLSIAKIPSGVGLNKMPGSSSNPPLYRVEARLVEEKPDHRGTRTPLIGAPVTAEIVLQKKALLSWLISGLTDEPPAP